MKFEDMKVIFQIAFITPTEKVLLEMTDDNEVRLPERVLNSYTNLTKEVKKVAKQMCNSHFLSRPILLEINVEPLNARFMFKYLVFVDQKGAQSFKPSADSKAITIEASNLYESADMTKDTARTLEDLVWPYVDVFKTYRWCKNKEGTGIKYMYKIFYKQHFSEFPDNEEK